MDTSIAKPKVKKIMTPKQKEARLANLAKGRKKRMDGIQNKKQDDKIDEYDLSSDSDMSEDSKSMSDDEAFVISRKKKPVREASCKKIDNIGKSSNKKKPNDSLKRDFDELKSIVAELASLQKKQSSKISRSSREGKGSTKIVVLPQSQPQARNNNNDSFMDALRKSLL